jgi:hypothetical protein
MNSHNMASDNQLEGIMVRLFFILFLAAIGGGFGFWGVEEMFHLMSTLLKYGLGALFALFILIGVIGGPQCYPMLLGLFVARVNEEKPKKEV